MKYKRLLAVLLAAVMLMGVLSCSFCSYAIMMVETQFVYDSVNMSWLKDLIVKEDMSSVNALAAQQNTLQAVSDYPYVHTSESFSEEVFYYQVLYTLDADMTEVAYLYMLQLVESLASSTAASGYSDGYIRSYLESLGIVYPTGDAQESSETLIVARALFSIISTDESYAVTRGTGLYEAFTDYLSTLIGVDVSYIIKFDSDGSLTGLQEYVMAACRYLLYNAGYAVDSNTSDEEVFRLIAIMTIKAQGISIDSSTATLDEIRIKYLCAMMCKIYDVTIDVPAFEEAVNANELDFYMLQLIGSEYGITVRNSVTYEEAFDIVSQNTDYFNLEEGEFYADIYEYNVQLAYKRDKIWVYPQTLGTTSESDGTQVKVKINGENVRENYYVDVALNSELSNESIVITVEYTDSSGTKSSSYVLNIYQGTETYVQSSGDITISGALSGVTGIITDLLAEVGLDSSIANLVSNIPFELPERFFSISSLLLPSFDTSSLGSSFLQALFGYSKEDDSNTQTDQLGGVGGLDTYNSSTESTQSMDFTGNISNITNIQVNTSGLETTTNNANELVIQNNQQAYPQVQEETEGNWFSDLMSDTFTVVILAVVLVLTFAVCLLLFLNILKARSENSGGKKQKKDKNS